MQIKVSAIVIAYNAEKYISACLHSLMRQSLKGIEIIVIDNGSTDRTYAIVEALQRTDRRIQIYKVFPNVGLPKGRNLGIKYARGEYIAFVDSDDLYRKTALEKLYSKAVKLSADVVTCNVATFWHLLGRKSVHHKMEWYEKSLGRMTIFDCPEQFNEQAAWAKLIKREYISSIDYTFTEGSFFCEDVPACTSLFLNTNSIATIPECLYLYRLRKDSLSHRMGCHQVDDFIYAMKKQDDILKKHKIKDETLLTNIYMVRFLLGNLLLSRMSTENVKYYFDTINQAYTMVDKKYLQNLFVEMPYAETLYDAIIEKDAKIYDKIKENYNI